MEPIDLEIGNWEQLEEEKIKRKVLKEAGIDAKLVKHTRMIWSDQDRAVIVLRRPLRLKIEEMRRNKSVKYVDDVRRLEIWEKFGWVRILSNSYCQKIKVCKLTQIGKIQKSE